MPLDSNDDLAQRREEALKRHNEETAAKKPAPTPTRSDGVSAKEPDSAREDALESHVLEQEIPGGLVGTVTAPFKHGYKSTKNFFHAACEVTARKLKWVAPVVKPFVAVARWSAPKIYRATVWSVPKMFTRKGPDNHRHFSALRSAFSVAALGVCLVMSPHYLPYVYYHATTTTYHIYVPNAGVFHNQQFNNPNQSGHVIAPRDEISTVFPKYINEKGQLEQTRFDIDSNGYFLFFRPDLAAAQLTPQSPYGAECTVKATGFYTLVPRYLRAPSMMKILNLRPEIVGVLKDSGPIAQARKAAGLEETDTSSSCAQLTEAEYEKVFGVKSVPLKAPKSIAAPKTEVPAKTTPATPVSPEQKAPEQIPGKKAGVPLVRFPGLGSDGRIMADWLNGTHTLKAPVPFADLQWNPNHGVHFTQPLAAHNSASPRLG